MKNKLLIIGAGEFGREVYNWALSSNGFGSEFIISGFLDDRNNILDGLTGYPNIISTAEDYNVQDNDVFICSIAEPKLRKEYIDIILKKGGKFINIIHNTSIIGANVKLGIGIVLCPYTILTCDISLGNYAIINCGSVIGHDVIIKEYSSLMVNVSVGGKCVIEENVFIGSNVNIIPKTIVGKNSLVGASSNVLKYVEANTKVFGNPAKKIF